MGLINLQDVLNATDTRQITYNVPEWGGDIIIKTLTAGARDDYEKGLLIKDENGQLVRSPVLSPAKFVAACVYQEDGQKMFRTDEHIKVLESKNYNVVRRIFEKCLEVNAMSDDSVGEEVKN